MISFELEEIYQNKFELLKKAQEIFYNSSSIIVKIGFELEFFLRKNYQNSPQFDEIFLANFIAELQLEIFAKFPMIYEVEKERGASQIEVKTIYNSDFLAICFTVIEVKNFIANFCQKKSLIADFSAQPFLDDCGSALQVNLSLHDAKNDKNLFDGDKKLQRKMAMRLLLSTNANMVFLAPSQSDFMRLDPSLNRNLFRKGKFSAPVNLSFGDDNRTCAIRFTKGESGKRMEYRVAAANSDPFLICSFLLLALACDCDELQNFEEIFGNAFDEKYCAPPFLKNFEEAKINFFTKENLLKSLFEKIKQMKIS